MESLTPATVPPALMKEVLEHYRAVGMLIEHSFARTPIVFVNYPNGIDQDGAYHVTTVPLSFDNLLWLIQEQDAIGFYTWAPRLLDYDRLRYGRILLEAVPDMPFERVKLAALAIRSLLFDVAKLEAVPLLDGGAGIALWIPLADAPQAAPLRVWLHKLCNRAVELHPDLVSTQYNTHIDGRVHLHVQSNAAGHYSAVPYSLRLPYLSVCTPIHWIELASFESADAIRPNTILDRLENLGDIFENDVKLIAKQTFAGVPAM